MKKEKNIDQALAAYRELTFDEQQQIENELEQEGKVAGILATYRRMDHNLSHYAADMQSQVTEQLGERLTSGFQHMIDAQTRRPATRWERFFSPWLQPPRRMIQVASAGICVLLLAALSLLLSNADLDGIDPMGRATVSAGDKEATIVGDGTTDPLQETAQPAAQDMLTASITITFGCESASCSIYNDVASAFHERYPDLRVMTVPIEPYVMSATAPDSDDEKVQKLAAAVDAYVYWPLEHDAVARYMYDLTPFIEDDPTIDFADYYPDAFSPFQWGDATWALPSNIIPTLLFYNRTLFDEGGVPYPATDWTQSDFLQVAKSLTRHRTDEEIQYGFVDFSDALRYGLSSALTASVKANSSHLPSQSMNENIEWYTDLALKYGVMPVSPNPKSEYAWTSENRARILRGDVAMWTDSLLNNWQKKDGLNSSQHLPEIGFAPLPVQVGKGLISWQPGYFISKETPHPQESWLWLNYLSEHHVSHYVGEEQFMVVPARRSTAERSGYWVQWSADERAVIESVLENPVSWPPFDSPQWWVREAVERAIDGVFAGQTVTEAMTIGVLSPMTDGTVSGDVPIIGQAIHDSFLKYDLYYKSEPSDDDAYVYFGGSVEPVSLGPLGVWHTAGLAPGLYSLRLRVMSTSRDYVDYFAHNIHLDSNDENAESASGSDENIDTFAYGVEAEMLGAKDFVQQTLEALNELSFTWVKQDILWQDFQPDAERAPLWDELYRVVTRTQEANVNLLLSVSGTPEWAPENGFDGAVDGPPADVQTYANFVGQLAEGPKPSMMKN